MYQLYCLCTNHETITDNIGQYPDNVYAALDHVPLRYYHGLLFPALL